MVTVPRLFIPLYHVNKYVQVHIVLQYPKKFQATFTFHSLDLWYFRIEHNCRMIYLLT
jgi:hypothetical protein